MLMNNKAEKKKNLIIQLIVMLPSYYQLLTGSIIENK